MKLRDTIGSGDISSSWEHRGGSGELLAQWSALEPVPRRANVHGRESAPSRQQERNSTRGCSNASRRCRPLPQQLPAPQEMLRSLDVTENVSEQDEGAVASRGRESAHVKRCPTRQKTRKSESDRHSLGEDEAMVDAPQCTVTALEPYGDGQLSSGGHLELRRHTTAQYRKPPRYNLEVFLWHALIESGLDPKDRFIVWPSRRRSGVLHDCVLPCSKPA